MIKLNPFAALLPIIGLLPAFHGSGTQQPTYKDFSFAVYTYTRPQRSNTITGQKSTKMSVSYLKKFFTKQYIISKKKEKLSLPVQGLDSAKVRKELFAIVDTGNKLRFNKQYKIWVEQPGGIGKTSEFVLLKKSTNLNKVTHIAVLVPETHFRAVIQNIKKWRNKTKNSANVQPSGGISGDNQTEDNKPWNWKKIAGFGMTGVVIACSIGGLTYYFFVPTKKQPSALSNQENQEKEEL